jgi:S-adenosylmethionine-diacylglycerol 3-amino-3-carboxypropyl transferase
MDWLSTHARAALAAEWQAIMDNAAPGARVIWRSGGMLVDFVDPVEVSVRGSRWRMGDLLEYHERLARELHAKDRVHTYGSFYVADLATV